MATKTTTTKSADTAILKNPRMTEKAANASTASVYIFDVAVSATKNEIAKAFAAKYKHSPVSVRTVTIPRKSYFRRGRLGFGTQGKKAYITLPKGVMVDII